MRTFDSSNRITYAQKNLLVLVEAWQLRSWCLESNLPHASLYKLAVGQSVPTFKAISYLVPYFAPAEWLFFTDEEIPYPIRTFLEWNPDDTSVFILMMDSFYELYGMDNDDAIDAELKRRAEQNATDWYKKLERIRQIVLKSEGKTLE